MGDACEGCKWIINTLKSYCNTAFFILAAILGLKNTLLTVTEDSEEAELCLLIESPLNDCPVPFPFQIYLSTFNDTAGML